MTEQNALASADPFPVIQCPDCRAIEPGAFFGSHTGALVRLRFDHFRDKRGFLYCADCGAVWDSLFVADEEAAVAPWQEGLFAFERMGLYPGFIATDKKWKRLAHRHMQQLSKDRRGPLSRTRDRIYDADGFASILDLPPDITEAARHHVHVASLAADWRTFRANGIKPRAEAITLAIVAFVLNRFSITRDLRPAQESIRFPKSPNPNLTDAEMAVATEAVEDWFTSHLTREEQEEQRE